MKFILFTVALVVAFAVVSAAPTEEDPEASERKTTMAPKKHMCLTCTVFNRWNLTLPTAKSKCESKMCDKHGKYAQYCYFHWTKMDKKKTHHDNKTMGGCVTDKMGKMIEKYIKFDANAMEMCQRNKTSVLCVCHGNNCNMSAASSGALLSFGLLFTALVALFSRA